MSDERLHELTLSAEVMGKLSQDKKAFAEAVEAYRTEDVERFQKALDRAGIPGYCRLVCQYLCSKHCVLVCRKLVGNLDTSDKLDVEEWRQFAEFTARIAEDTQLLSVFIDAIDKEDSDAFGSLLKRLQAERFGHQLCHWLCQVRCRFVCRRLCPESPLITAVGQIPTGRIAPSGYAAGPSSPPGPTPSDTKSPGGVGDHPYGGTTNIKGVFNTAGATEYKVEFTPVGGASQTITTPVSDWKKNPTWSVGDPISTYYLDYTRSPVGDWYAIADMGLAGNDYLTDWQTAAVLADGTTPKVPDGEYDLRLTVRTATAWERSSSPVRVIVDNNGPKGPGTGGRPIMSIRQGDRELECCETVNKDGGDIVIHIEGEDVNFSSLSVALYGGCDVAVTVFEKTYDGNLSDHGAPAPGIDIPWNPWTAGVEPCCYVVFFRIYDRAITNNTWSGGNAPGVTWRSITIT